MSRHQRLERQRVPSVRSAERHGGEVVELEKKQGGTN
jgi:hypothetical protein